jgi:hypothetical protein
MHSRLLHEIGLKAPDIIPSFRIRRDSQRCIVADQQAMDASNPRSSPNPSIQSVNTAPECYNRDMISQRECARLSEHLHIQGHLSLEEVVRL